MAHSRFVTAIVASAFVAPSAAIVVAQAGVHEAKAARPTIFGAAQGFGLRLERGRGVVDVLVIDHVEQPTSD